MKHNGSHLALRIISACNFEARLDSANIEIERFHSNQGYQQVDPGLA